MSEDANPCSMASVCSQDKNTIRGRSGAPSNDTGGAEERAAIDGFLFGDIDRVMVLYRNPSSNILICLHKMRV
jgi:hypothetical protein